jgi:hypothetical protein
LIIILKKGSSGLPLWDERPGMVNHSLKGANTTAVLFSVIQSCKLCGVNPREYLHRLVEDMHQGKEPYTPATFKGLS